MCTSIAALNNVTLIQEFADGDWTMDLENSNIRTISEYLKTTLNQDNGGTAENNHCVSPQNIDYFSKIAQAMNKVEQLLFNNYELNQDDHIIVSECYESNDITAEDKAKLLSAQVKSLKQQLVAKEAELQATQQELNYTNQDLVSALKTNILTLAEAKEFAKNMLLDKQSIYKYLAKLLSAIYNSTVEVSDLAPISKIDQENVAALKQGSTVLKCESINQRNRIAELKDRSKRIISKTASLRKK